MRISIFSLGHILAIALNRRSPVASSVASSSPSCPTSFSLSASLISPTLTIHLYVVSMASILARSSYISLSTVGSGIDMGLYILLSKMAIKKFLFLCYKKQTNFFVL
jgi:hypothetical protein